jgi:hypothetical protein
MLLRFSLSAVGALLLVAAAQAQNTARLLPVPGVKDAGTLNIATGTWTRGANAKIAYAVIFDNTCTGAWYTAIEQTRVTNDGRLPSTSSPQIDQPPFGGGHASTSLVGTNDVYTINHLQIAYCTTVVLPTHEVSIWECYASCDDVTTATGRPPTITFQIPGLPGAPVAGSLACWQVGLDLLNATASFNMQGDCDGTWDGTASLDNFGYSWIQLSPSSSAASGPLINGDPDALLSQGPSGTGCCVGCNTVFWSGSNVPAICFEGSGLSSDDSFGFDDWNGAAYVANGCYWFGGYSSTTPKADHYFQLRGSASPSCDMLGTAYCFGHVGNPSGNVCPCGNNNDGTDPLFAGCANSTYASGANLRAAGCPSISADTVLLTGVHAEPSNTSMFFQANNNLDGNSIYLDNGLQCAGGGLIRLKVKMNDAAGSADSGPMVITTRSARLGHTIQPGETLYYQWWYRETGDICGADDDANTSNGFEITWSP